jgi:hypothetical protein
MNNYKDLIEQLQDLMSEINYLRNQKYSLNNQSEIVRLNYFANDVSNLLETYYKEEFNKI